MNKNQEAINLVRAIKYKTGKTQAVIAGEIGISPTYLSDALNGRVPFSANLKDRLYELYSRLYTGEGEMLTSGGAHNVAHPPADAIKYYPNVSGSLGGVQFLDNPDESVQYITIPGYSDCQYAINAFGDSMFPLIRNGQIVLMSPWTERFIDWGKIYLVVTQSGYRAIKRVYPGKTADTITCRSENAEVHPPFEIERADIFSLYLVKGWICRDVQ